MKSRGKTSRLKTTFRLLQRITWVFLSILTLTLMLYLGNRAYRELSRSPLFRVTSIAVKGNHYLSKTDIIYYLGINERSNLLTLNLKSLCQKLIDHPWIKKASIQRSLPSSLAIYIEERSPVAIIKAGNLYYVDRDGAVFDTINQEAGYDYPLLTGPRRPSDIPAYTPLIREALTLINPKTNALISEIHLDLTHGLTLITLNEALPVNLGLTDLPPRMQRFQAIYHYLMRREIRVKAIDCRYPDRVVVKYIKSPRLEGKREKVG